MSKPKVAIVKTGGLKGSSEFLGGKFVRYDEDIAREHYQFVNKN